ncbi:DUF2169 family type VI secretion system accessory protein [Nannocystis punicea]|uniref:DUF2169 domain-containing protein n=1 Tax=Nannocystis punicea TaxID=2995304 RepID=A0ABY7HG40_9BACT|nr:DUF2169 domain-containing protein [Nannocystis poenicansa]WAS98035.1 DUF2169 domain-containing protein [Nannocystis poenicansa]
MTALHNLTPFAAQASPSVDAEGRDVLVVCVAATFVMDEPPRVAHEQVAPPSEDVYWGEPGASSLRIAGQTAYFRPGTDIYLEGCAWTPGGRPAERSLVELRVGPCRVAATVTGERRWTRGLVGLRPSAPQRFTRLPLRFEFSAGGADDPRNPVGRGYASAQAAEDQPLPAIEAVHSPCERWEDRPPPVGFGPVARSWQPRLGFAGTYDSQWVEQRAPLWPADLDLRFFNAAAPELVATPGLVGGELVHLEGVSPDGAIAFHLPRLRLRATLQDRRGRRGQAMVLDGLALAAEDRRFTLTWRTSFAVAEDWLDLEGVFVRVLESWEVA